MDSVGGGAVLVLAMLHDALVEGEIRDEPFHPASALGEIITLLSSAIHRQASGKDLCSLFITMSMTPP